MGSKSDPMITLTMEESNALEREVLDSVERMSINTQTQAPLTDYFDQVLNLREQDECNLEDLKKKIKVLQNTHETTKQHLASLEKKVEVLKKETENLQEQKALKKKQLLRVKKQHEKQEDTVLHLRKLQLKDSESQLILDRNKKELLLYKQMTGISWNYQALPHLVAGYVTNKETCFLKTFSFDKEKMTSSQITEALWKIISLSSLKNSSQ